MHNSMLLMVYYYIEKKKVRKEKLKTAQTRIMKVLRVNMGSAF